MKRREIVILLIVILFLCSSNLLASTLNLGEDVYKGQVTNFHSGEGDYILFDLGYGVSKYKGYGLEVITPLESDKGSGIVEVEYQYIPESKQEDGTEFNYAFKLGGVSGSIFDDSKAGGKVGFIVERSLEEKELYCDVDLISSSGIIVDAELGACAQLGEGIVGLFGVKIVTSNEEDYDTLTGTNFGVRMEF